MINDARKFFLHTRSMKTPFHFIKMDLSHVPFLKDSFCFACKLPSASCAAGSVYRVNACCTVWVSGSSDLPNKVRRLQGPSFEDGTWTSMRRLETGHSNCLHDKMCKRPISNVQMPAYPTTKSSVCLLSNACTVVRGCHCAGYVLTATAKDLTGIVESCESKPFTMTARCVVLLGIVGVFCSM